MPSSLAAERRPAPVQSLDTQLTFGPVGVVKGPEGVQRLDPCWTLACLSRAIDRTLPRKEAAYLMGLDPSQMNRELKGEGKFQLTRTERLPQATWFAWIDELRQALGVPDPQAEIERAMQDITRGISLLAARATR